MRHAAAPLDTMARLTAWVGARLPTRLLPTAARRVRERLSSSQFRLPVMWRREHEREVQALGRAAADLGVAVQRATAAALLATQQWQVQALRFLRERDEARAEVERLRATVAELVIRSATGEAQRD